jgi:hypothetical protein
MKDDISHKITQSNELNYVSEKEKQEIVAGFQLLQIKTVPHYSDPYQFAINLQKVSNLQYEGLQFFTSGSSLAPKF